MNPFETETMADLFLRQGHREKALGIYRRLLERTIEENARGRITRRIAAAERGDAPPSAGDGPTDDRGSAAGPIPTPGVRASRSGDLVTIEWRLPAEVQRPALEVLLVKKGPRGVVTETRAIEVQGSAGSLTVGAPDLHSARVAAGSRGPRGFVPLAVAGEAQNR